MKKTTVMINEYLLEEAKKAAGVQSNREALRKELGTYDIDLSPKELEALRKEFSPVIKERLDHLLKENRVITVGIIKL